MSLGTVFPPHRAEDFSKTLKPGKLVPFTGDWRKVAGYSPISVPIDISVARLGKKVEGRRPKN